MDGQLIAKYAKESTTTLLDSYLSNYVNNVAAWKVENYVLLRQLAYPPMADYLDGIVKNDAIQIETYISQCQAVKERFPKE